MIASSSISAPAPIVQITGTISDAALDQLAEIVLTEVLGDEDGEQDQGGEGLE